MVPFVESRTNQVVHPRVRDHKRLGRGSFHIEHRGQQGAGVADQTATGLEEDFQPQRFEQRHDRFGIVVETDALAAVGHRLLPPVRRPAFQRAVVDDTNPAPDAEKLDAVGLFQLLHDRHQLADRFGEGRGLENLRPDMGLDSAQTQMRQLRRLLVNPEDPVDPDAELVVALAGRNVFVRLRVDIRIDPQRHRRLDPHRAGHLVEKFQFRLRLDVERINTLPQRVFDFLPRLAHPGERAGIGATAGFEHAEQLAPRHDIEPSPFAGQQVEDGEIGIRLHGETHPVVEPRQRLVEAPVVIPDGRRAVDVKRRALLRRQLRQIDALAMQHPVTVGKFMHKRVKLAPRGP